MKRIWIGILLLSVLLVAGFWLSGFMKEAHLPVAQDLRRAGELALEEPWGQAEADAKRNGP